MTDDHLYAAQARALAAEQDDVHRLVAAVRAHRGEPQCPAAPFCPGHEVIRLISCADRVAVSRWLVAACHLLADHADRAAGHDQMLDAMLPLIADYLAEQASAHGRGGPDGDRPA